MKIKKSFKKNVSDSLENCRKTIVASVKELCELVDYKHSGKIGFEKPVTLTTSLMIHESHLQTNTFFADCIGWNPDTDFFLLYLDGELVESSSVLSVDETFKVYKALEKVVSSF